MQRTNLIESLESRQMYSVAVGTTAFVSEPLSAPRLTAPAVATTTSTSSGYVRSGAAVGFDPQPDPPSQFSVVRI